jgi:hypothetical protein
VRKTSFLSHQYVETIILPRRALDKPLQTAGEKFVFCRNIEELSIFWQYALGFLNRLRSQIFLHPLVGAIPCVVLTQGGSALDICFNTIAVRLVNYI